MGSVECEIDHEKRRTIIRCIGDIDGRAVLTRLRAFWEQHPEIVGYDCLTDVLNYTGDMSFDDLRATAAAWYEFGQRRDAGARTAVISGDRFAETLMKVVALVFDTRRFGLFRSLDAARSWLDRDGERLNETAASLPGRAVAGR